MSDWDDNDAREPASPEELCRQAFSRCSNWPTDRAGQIGLAQGLKQASDRYKISQEDIIAKCREDSSFCPTDHELLRVGADIFRVREAAAEAKRNQYAEWEKQYGKPKRVDLAMEGQCSC